MSISWVILDLDDTLHDFRHASTTAIAQVCNAIRADYPHLAYETIETQYRLASSKLQAAFTDGRSSHEYRYERFTSLLAGCGIAGDNVARYVKTYGSTYESSLTRITGSMDLLTGIAAGDMKIAVITEGPQDAQERVLSILDFSPHVDLLLTSNRERVSKQDGLFQRFLTEANAAPAQCVVIGDSLENDIQPALHLGIGTIHYSEAPEVKACAAHVHIDSLTEISCQVLKEFSPL